MDVATRRRPVVLPLLWLAFASAHVEEPTNITLHCQNLRNTLNWSYGPLLPELRFRVDYHLYVGASGVLWVDPPAQQADLSFLSNPDGEYLVFVAAVIGQNKSNPAPPDGITFSYFMDSQTATKCSVDLPPVNITTQPDDTLTVRFVHPWLWHRPPLQSDPKPKPRRKKSHDDQLPVFKYSVVVGQRQHHHRCTISVCEQKVPVEPGQEEHCVNITGELKKMAVKSRQLYCAVPFRQLPPGQKDYIIHIVIGLVLLAVVAFVLFLVYKKRTRPGSATLFEINGTAQGNRTAVPEVCVVARVEQATSPSRHLLSSEEDEGDETPSDLCISNGVTDEGDAEGARTEYIEGSGELDGDDSSDPDEAPPTGYEKRERVDMGNDEMAEGYRS